MRLEFGYPTFSRRKISQYYHRAPRVATFSFALKILMIINFELKNKVYLNYAFLKISKFWCKNSYWDTTYWFASRMTFLRTTHYDLLWLLGIFYYFIFVDSLFSLLIVKFDFEITNPWHIMDIMDHCNAFLIWCWYWTRYYTYIVDIWYVYVLFIISIVIIIILNVKQ